MYKLSGPCSILQSIARWPERSVVSYMRVLVYQLLLTSSHFFELSLANCILATAECYIHLLLCILWSVRWVYVVLSSVAQSCVWLLHMYYRIWLLVHVYMPQPFVLRKYEHIKGFKLIKKAALNYNVWCVHANRENKDDWTAQKTGKKAWFVLRLNSTW